MSAELIKARSHLARINSHLKQGKLLGAVNALHEALAIVLRSQLMKAEKQEFSTLIDQAVYQLSHDPKLKEVYPLLLSYTPGEEKALLAQIVELHKELEANHAEQARDALAEMLKRKEKGLQLVQKQLEDGDPGAAQKTAAALIHAFPHDSELKAQIADLFVNSGHYQEAYGYLVEALRDDPKAVHLYNRIGIVLRKMGDFKTAEQYYNQALEHCDNDEYLFFNIGRLYHDWKKWDKMAQAAEKALRLNPEFAQAKKMLLFARKRLEA